jgi:hypothetical protein
VCILMYRTGSAGRSGGAGPGWAGLLRAGAGPGAGRRGQAGRLATVCQGGFLVLSLVDLHSFNADPDPACFLIADPDPNADPDLVPDPGF